MTEKGVFKRLKALASPEKAEVYARFFKTGPGEYGEGDMFLGLTMPELRKTAREFRDLPFPEVERLLANRYHEARMVGLLILTYAYERADESRRKEIYEFLLNHRSAMNNWDLVDVIVPKIVGAYLAKAHPSGPRTYPSPSKTRELPLKRGAGERKAGEKGSGRERKSERKILYEFAQSDDLWERRIAIIATFAFIREDDFDDTIAIAEMFLDDPHDLIHKVTGWMLREVGKRDIAALRQFLDKHAAHMPRTMLRYSIEKLLENERKKYMTVR